MNATNRIVSNLGAIARITAALIIVLVSTTVTRAADLFGALESADGTVTIRWETDSAIGVIGYHVWRVTGGERTRISSSMISGGPWFSADPESESPTDHRAFRWTDGAPPSDRSSLYWIEEVHLDGESAWYGPVTPLRAIVTPRDRRRTASLVPALNTPSTRALGAVGSVQSFGAGSTVGILARPDKTPGVQYPELQWSLATSGALKIFVDRDGWYRVGQEALVTAGLDPLPNPKELFLYAGGSRVPIFITGEADGRLDPGDAIHFYGRAVDTASTDRQAYWLIAAKRGGTTIPVSSLSRGSANPASSFPFTVERKDRVLFFAALKNGDADSFFGPAIVPSSWTSQPIDIHLLDPAATVGSTLEVTLQGAGEATHAVHVELNGSLIGDIVWFGMTATTARFNLPTGSLVDGTNNVRLIAYGGPSDVSVIDRIRVTYPHLYVADQNWLRFSAAGATTVSVRGFTSPDITVVDVTDPLAPQVVVPSVSSDGSSFTMSVVTPRGKERVLLASTIDRLPAPARIVLDSPSSLNATSNAADLVIVGPSSFLSAAGPLVTARETEGYRPLVVDIEDVYDEFNFGAKDPAAIRAFLQVATARWASPPRFLLLLGDASVDPRGYLGPPYEDIVPTKLVETAFIKTASDDWFSDFDGDGIADIATGRLPARTPAEAVRLVSRTLAYASEPDSDGWTNRVDLVTGPDDGYNKFGVASAELETFFPPTVDVRKSYSGELGIAGARTQMMSNWNGGTLFVNYFGHGQVASWNQPALLDTTSARQLLNGNRMPLAMALTCLTGFFHDPWNESLGEALLRADSGGAVAVWGSSTLTYLFDQQPTGNEAVRLLFGDRLTIGEVMMRAKQVTNAADVRKSWILLGDPTLRLRR